MGRAAQEKCREWDVLLHGNRDVLIKFVSWLGPALAGSLGANRWRLSKLSCTVFYTRRRLLTTSVTSPGGFLLAAGPLFVTV